MLVLGHSVEDYIRCPRLFVSCSAKDKKRAGDLVRELEQDGYRVDWLGSFPAATSWRQTIEAGISTAHAMVVLWTSVAATSQWVQTEIGFAIGRCVPVFLAFDGGGNPEGMAGEFQHFDRSQVLRRLRKDLPQTLNRSPEGAVPMTIARFPEERTDWLGQRAEEIPETSVIRQVAVFSTFAIPPDDPEHSPTRWDRRDQGSRTPGHRKKQHRERRVFDWHAQGAGARLILAPRILRRSADESRARLEVLREFLCASNEVAVALADSIPRGNLTIVGDRFLCESQAPGKHGFAHTVFTSHAPTVLRAIRQFENSFRSLDQGSGTLEESRAYAIARIDEILHSLPT